MFSTGHLDTEDVQVQYGWLYKSLISVSFSFHVVGFVLNLNHNLMSSIWYYEVAVTEHK